MAREHWIVDGDAHTRYGKDFYQKWLPKKYHDRAPKLVKDRAGGDAWQYSPEMAPYTISPTTRGSFPHYDDRAGVGKTYEEVRPGCWDGKERLKDMDEDGIDAQILFGDNSTNSYFMTVEDKDFQLAGIQAYNNYLFEDFCAADPNRLIGMAQIPNLGVQANLAELDRTKKMGCRGITLRAWPSGKDKISPEDDPFWAVCEELSMPITNHGFFSGTAQIGASEAPGAPGLGLAYQVAPFVAQLILTGALDRFPKLQVGCIETQAGWVPLMLEAMDDRYWRNGPSHKPNIERLPSDYWRSNFFCTFIIDKYGIANRHAIGVENMQWSSDYPHSGSDWPYSRKVIEYSFAGVPEDEKRKMICGNAVKTYGLI